MKTKNFVFGVFAVFVVGLLIFSSFVFAKTLQVEKKFDKKDNEKIFYKKLFSGEEKGVSEEAAYELWLEGRLYKRFDFVQEDDKNIANIEIPETFKDLEIRKEGKSLLVLEKNILNEIFLAFVVVISLGFMAYMRFLRKKP